jgi:hypothetical protein
MMVIAEQPTTALTLAERAKAAWIDKRAEIAIKQAHQLQAKRAELERIVRNKLVSVLDVDQAPADLRLFGDPDAFLYRSTTCTAEFTVEGERFEVLFNDAGSGWTLIHHWTCPRCLFEADGEEIEDLADFGDWLERAPKLCRCARAESEAERLRLDVERRIAKTIVLGEEVARVWDVASVPTQAHGVDHQLIHAAAEIVTAKPRVIETTGQTPKLTLGLGKYGSHPTLFGELAVECEACCQAFIDSRPAEAQL